MPVKTLSPHLVTTGHTFPVEGLNMTQSDNGIAPDENGQPPRKDTQRDTQEAVVKDADKTDVADRDRVHGDGTSVGLK